MQELLKKASAQQIRQPRLDLEANGIAKHNRGIVKVRWEAKKNKIRNGIPLPSEPFPRLVDHPKFSELLAASNGDGMEGSTDGIGAPILVGQSQAWSTLPWQYERSFDVYMAETQGVVWASTRAVRVLPLARSGPSKHGTGLSIVS